MSVQMTGHGDGAFANAATPSKDRGPTLRDYLAVTVGLVLFGLAMVCLRSFAGDESLAPQSLLAPQLALAGLIALVWLSMVIVRNYAILRRLIDGAYYRDYQGEAPPDWIERPARTYTNLLESPPLFFVVCLLMMVTQRVDSAQLAFAWVFVGLRVLHAIVLIGWNYVPLRFAAFVASFAVLITLFVRFALRC